MAQESKSEDFSRSTQEDVVGTDFSRTSRFTLWETKARFYLVAYNTAQTRFHVLKIDRTPAGHHRQQDQAQGGPSQSKAEDRHGGAAPSTTSTSGGDDAATPLHPSSSAYWQLNIVADAAEYDRAQITELLDMISDGNKANGGLKEVGHFFGLVGLIRFTSTYYMVLISRRSVVALLGGHYIYHCDETKIIPVCHPSTAIPGRTKAMDQEELRLLHIFKQVDLSKNFYFSYTYDLTRTLQENLTGKRFEDHASSWGYCEKFIWNHHLLSPAFDSSAAASDWVLPLCYGFVDQAKLSVLNRTIHVTLIARRSRHFAGARFLKRGANDAGQVANDVETEQIVSEALTTPFYAAEHAHCYAANPRFTSYVMHRGSIPIFWTQDSTNMSPRPPIEIPVADPFYSSAALHFDDMFARYGSPLIILNLIKSREKTPRETKLLKAFGECVAYLNQFLPDDKKMVYIAWDMSRASKSHDQDVIGILEDIAEETIERTGFFHSGPEPTRFEYAPAAEAGSDGSTTRHPRRQTILTQTGVARVNCVDCLDRTNAAQFVIGKAALGHQLHALGLLEHPALPFDSDAVDMLTEMYHDLGDTIALQYGGSHLVNTMETYRKINQWTSHSRDMLEGLKRYYANSFVDADKQAAINLFLGIDEFTVAPSGQATRRANPSDQQLYRPRRRQANRRDYQAWYTPRHVERIEATAERVARLHEVVRRQEGFWAEYYRPRLFTDLMRHHAFKMTAVMQHQPVGLVVTAPTSERDDEGRTSSPSLTGRASGSFSGGSAPGHRSKKDSISSMATLSTARPGSGSGGTVAGGSSHGGVGPTDAAILVTSPFTSRLAPAQQGRLGSNAVGHRRTPSSPAKPTSRAAQRLRSTSGSSFASGGSSSASTTWDSSSTAVGSSAPTATAISAAGDPKALIGGVRRWMSLNNGRRVGEASPLSGQRGQRRASGMGAAGEPEAGATSSTTSSNDKAASLASKGPASSASAGPAGIGGWTNPFVPSTQAHQPVETLLESSTHPTVAPSEAREYALWLEQFTGDLTLDASAGAGMWGETPLEVRTVGAKRGDVHLADADVEVYVKAVRRGTCPVLAAGTATYDAAGTGAGAGEAPHDSPRRRLMAMRGAENASQHQAASAVAGADEVDPILLNYASLASGGNATLGMNVGIKGASEAKLRAFRSWLSIGERGR
ncbi:hypothetical protein BDZ90DRAFT_230116 [Jaminaea rosea]|uniref:SAC domain-containing protein n=1 Tax=Jaminaea rosea TaxID=1569628 RepID=A0A316V0W7_9BASI|nr:hypothetical protein BDZ90DRAFT_230116 [Jaminaea rosea]PWN31122.1 hypothetical protein BDZ90DRAFT_230116 [Jaminaea rosea]